MIEVVSSMLKADEIHHRLRLVEKEYPKRPLYYQRDETDYEFFKRILAESGIYFFFEHAVQDSLTGGAIAAAGMGGEAVAAAGGMLGGSVGNTMSSVGGKAQEVTHEVTCLVLADQADGATALQDFAAINDLANQAMKKLTAAAVGAMGVPKELSNAVGASTGFDACDAITMDDGTAVASGDERAYGFAFRRSLRPKSAWTLERDSTVPESWAHRERIDAVSMSKPSLDFHMSLGRNGVGVTGGASLKMDVEAPEIPAEKLEQELISRNAGWLRYPSERNPKETDHGSFTDKHPHLKRPLEQLRRDREIAIGETDCRRLGAGYRFALAKHPAAALNADYIVTELSVDAFDADMLDLDPSDPRRDRPYSAKLVCVPGDVAPRPPLPEKKKLGMELGTVVRWEESMDMVSFERGEVLVRLHWDTDHKGHDRKYPTSSKQEHRDRVLHIPVLQPWAGDGYGLQVIPRDGMQVVVGYLDDQGDRPVILGCLHSDAAPPAWAGWDAQKVGFRSKSRWPRGTLAEDGIGWTTGWSEISIDDTGNHEKVTIRGAKDVIMAVGGIRTSRVEGDSEDVVEGERLETTGKDSRVAVTGARHERVGGSLVRATGGASSDAVEGDRAAFTQGDSGEIVQGSRFLRVAKDMASHVEGSERSTVAGDRTIVTHGSHRLRIGQKGDDSVFETVIDGTSTTHATDDLIIRSDKRIVFICGKTRLEIGPDTLTIRGKNIAIQGTEKTVVGSKGSSVELDDNAQIFAKEIHLMSQGATVDLTSEANIQSKKIALASGSGTSKSADSKTDDAKTVPFKVRILDHDLTPLANKKGLLYCKDERISVTTDGDGQVSADLSPDIDEVLLRVWTAEYPNGPYRDHIIQLRASLDTDETVAMLTRLANLGFYAGPVTADPAKARSALTLFQRAHVKSGMKVTGELDDATKAKLKEVHKS